MNVKPIRSDDEYRATLADISGLMAAAPESEEGERLKVLVVLVEVWEREHFPMESRRLIDRQT